MHFLTTPILLFLALFEVTSASFYDNPPFEFPSEASRSVAELERKWGTDVGYYPGSLLYAFWTVLARWTVLRSTSL